LTTAFHAKYYAHELTKRCSSEKLEKLSQSLFNATVDLNPHQIEAALFAFRSPLSRGAILADEVGLGKTIEAGLILSQLWAERKRRILIILPTSLRNQWNQELLEKFFINSVILESKSYNAFVKAGHVNPFEQNDSIVLCSYHFARSKAEDIRKASWDLVVIDEAHRLRNVFKKGNKIARAILEAVEGSPKILLTATPLQNSLNELYGLVGFIDPHIFGDERSFRAQFGRGDLADEQFADLKRRLQPICQRTLRRQVLEYVRYTNRIPITQDFTPSEDEQLLYDSVSNYLRREYLQALPPSQRKLMTLVLRKLLASSTFAISATLQTLLSRLQTNLKDLVQEEAYQEQIGTDFEALDEMQEEWVEADEDKDVDLGEGGLSETEQANLQRSMLEDEISELTKYRDLAQRITHNAKGAALLVALSNGFAKLEELGANRKAIIFTESRRTQAYLKDHLEANGYAGQVVVFNGTNTDPEARAIYADWLERHKGDDCVTGSKTADTRSALVEYFRDRASVMIATESAGEGINLQFCSLVVNYDLPWNPQRIEQRIGRCHRYGQKHDVVVINFLNRRNEADIRVFQLLSEKFQLFNGVFGASDEVLGALESGVDFEKRIADIYQDCRTSEDIDRAFEALQRELDEQIKVRLADTRTKLLENFDEDVHSRLRMNLEQTRQQMSRLESWLWSLSRYELGRCAEFDHDECTFTLGANPPFLTVGNAPLGTYRLISKKEDHTPSHHYRLGHPLAEGAVTSAKQRELPPHELTFNYSGHGTKISVVESLAGMSGWISLKQLSIESLDNEDHLIFSGFTDDGRQLDQETCEKLFSVSATAGADVSVSDGVCQRLQSLYDGSKSGILGEVAERNNTYFDEEMEKLEKWAEDLKEGLEFELKEIDKEIRLLKKEAKVISDLDAKVDAHRRIKELEKKRNQKRRDLFEAQDGIEEKKEGLISNVEQRLRQEVVERELFTVNWRVV
jgi:superfamily II DNA/RNA helicase